MIYFVDGKAGKTSGADGSKKSPFAQIQQAADVAVDGDEVVVAPGIYREYVNPKNGGTAENPIVYKSEKPLAAHITGAELLNGWKKMEGGIYTVRVSNTIFGDFNPYVEKISGDWFDGSLTAHLGDVFINGRSMYEVSSLKEVVAAEVYENSWEGDFSRFKWYAEQDEASNETVFYANFQGKNPENETIEITVRKHCFYPQAEGLNYITFCGFTVSKAATQWAPPTAYQEGMIGPHWSKGWIIEDCEIFEAKTNGISLGKYYQPQNDNKWLKTKYKDGTQTERECVCLAQAEGWSKVKIGSHVVRRCNIHHCGQTGIVGHLGGVFSLIEENHIHHINNKQNLAGAEIGGIKMHAAIDCIFRKNHIHHCTRGLWLDWQAQGTRVTQNYFHHNTLPEEFNQKAGADGGNGEDLFIEVSHGPTLVDNNLFLSDRAVKLAAQGVALVHNLVGGSFVSVGRGTDNGAPGRNSARYTPYHLPHRTEVAGWMTFLHGDCKFFNNVFVQQKIRPHMKELMKLPKDCWEDNNVICGTLSYDGFPDFEEWNAMFDGYCGHGCVRTDRYYSELPVWFGGNVYLNGAKPAAGDKGAVVDSSEKVCFEYSDGDYRLETNLCEVLKKLNCAAKLIKTEDIPMAFETEQLYENPDGSPITFDEDFFGEKRTGEQVIPGPFAKV